MVIPSIFYSDIFSFVFYELTDGSRCYVGDTPERHTNTEVGTMQTETYRMIDGELWVITLEKNNGSCT